MSFLLHMLRGVSRRGEFTLSSGKQSDLYVDARLVTLDPIALRAIGKVVFNHAHNKLGVTAIAGPVTAACPIVTAAGLAGVEFHKMLKLCFVRKEAKRHGTRRFIEGPPLGSRDRVLIVDDVLTSGGSLRFAANQVKATGAQVYGAWVLLDRQEGGKEALESDGIALTAMFTKKQLLEGWD